VRLLEVALPTRSGNEAVTLARHRRTAAPNPVTGDRAGFSSPVSSYRTQNLYTMQAFFVKFIVYNYPAQG
jgi:hypothetical protein